MRRARRGAERPRQAVRYPRLVGIPPMVLIVTGLVLVCGATALDAAFGVAAPGRPPAALGSFALPVSHQARLRAQRVPLGLYAGPDDTAAVPAMARWAGRRPAYAMDFVNGSTWGTISHPGPLIAPWEGTGVKMIWGVPIIPDSGGSLAQGATGAYDWAFVQVAQALVAGGQGSSIIRLGWEFNGSWFPWQAAGHARQFVQYWRQVVDTMRSVPGARFTFMWSPTRGDFGVGNLADYYPGDRWVDYVGLDVYDDSTSYQTPRLAWLDIASGPYGLTWAQTFAVAHHKPFVLPEWGLWSRSAGQGGGDDPYFVDATARWIARHPVAILVVWDWGTTALGPAEPIATREFRRDFG